LRASAARRGVAGLREKATLRLVAIRASRNMSGAAERLGMAPVSLSRWLDRRKLPPRMVHDSEPGTPAREHDHSAPEGTRFELVSADDGGDLLDAEERAELGRELEASIAEADAGQTTDFSETMAELRAKRSAQDDH
jgi:hypothetical protein